MRTFRSALREAGGDSDPGDRRWLYVPYDQLGDHLGPLAREAPEALGLVLLECPGKAARRPYHIQKLALVLASQRHFALEQAKRGVAIRYEVVDGYADGLGRIAAELGPLEMLRPAEWELRYELADLVDAGTLVERPHDGWLTTEKDWTRAVGSGRDRSRTWRMDGFYRVVRQRTGYLMADGAPAGGKASHDAANRKPWSGSPPAPQPPRFRHDDVTKEVGTLLERDYGDHPGTLDLGALAVTRAQVDRMWEWALTECLQHFGPYEDAMSRQSRGLFHTRISPYLNLQRLDARQVLDDVLGADLPLQSAEGFLRQVIGWREFMRHVHEATEGFRRLPGDTRRSRGDRGATPDHLAATRDLPAAWWDAPSGLTCLDTVVEQVWEEGWTHHIPRLMVLSNLATLLDLSPRQLTDWFWVGFIDAFDWVVEPNVLGMGTYAVGDLFLTKPYVSGAAYIDRMSDYCSGCRFDPKKTCPITDLYWAFLARKRDTLQGNHRLAMPMASLRKRSAERRAADARVFDHVSEVLADGGTLTPDGVVAARKGGSGDGR